MIGYIVDFARSESTAECEELSRDVRRLEDEASEDNRYGIRTYKDSSKHFENRGGM